MEVRSLCTAGPIKVKEVPVLLLFSALCISRLPKHNLPELVAGLCVSKLPCGSDFSVSERPACPLLPKVYPRKQYIVTRRIEYKYCSCILARVRKRHSFWTCSKTNMAHMVPLGNIETRHYINGAFSCSSDGATFQLKSPYSHKKIADVSEASIEDTNRAVAAAKAAFAAWSNLDIPTRGGYMRKMAILIREASQELAQLDALSMGRPISSYFDANYAAEQMDHYAEAGWEARGETSLNTPGFVNMTFRQPYGPVAIIIPWNIPVAMWASRIAPALAAGCTVVLKSSEKAPLSVWDSTLRI